MEQLTHASNTITRATINMVILLIPYLVACHPVTPPPVVDPVGSEGDCTGACANLERLQCPGWDGSPGPDDEMGTADDVACTPTCESIVVEDPSFLAYQGCIADAPDCDIADRCFEADR